MKEIVSNNIQCVNSNGKTYFLTFHALKELIWLQKHEVKEIEVDIIIKGALPPGTSPAGDIHKGKHKVKQIVPGRTVLSYGYWLGLKAALEDGKEITIRDWKFKVI